MLAIINAVVMNNGCMYLLGSCFFSLDICPGVHFRVIWQFYFQLFKEYPHFSPQCLYHSLFCQQCRRISFFLHPFQHFLFVDFFFTHVKKSILTGVVLICISLTTISVEHLFMPSLEKSLFRSSSHVLSGLFVLMLLSVICFLQILEPNPFQSLSHIIYNIFSQSVRVAFAFCLLFLWLCKNF